MTTVHEGVHAGGFLVSEANGMRSREVIVVQQGEVLVAGQVLAKIGTKYVAYDNDATGNAAAGILFDGVDATDGDKRAVGILRDAEVNAAELEWGDDNDEADITAGVADLLALGIVLR